MTHHLLCKAVLASAFLFTQAYAGPIYDAGPLAFRSDDQSMWGPGEALVKSDSLFLGTQWGQTTLKTATIGGIAGNANQVIIPAFGAITVPVFVPRIFVPTPTWSNPFKGYFTGCNCFKDVQITGPTDAVTADTRTGAQLDVHTKGKVGLEIGYSIDSGSVDTTANFGATAELPDAITAGEFFSLATNSNFESGTINTQSPHAEAYVSAILQLSGSVDAQACALTFGCKTGSFDLPTIDMNQKILSIDPNSVKLLDGIGPGGQPLAEIPLLNQTITLQGGLSAAVPPIPGFKVTAGPFTVFSTLPPTPTVTVDLASATVQVPNIATSGSKSGESVSSEGRDDLLSVQLDLDGAATMFAGMPPAGLGFDLIDIGVFKLSASLDLIDVDAGPVLGLTQDFEFTPTLKVALNFSKAVMIEGMAAAQTMWEGLWSGLPNFAIFEDTEVTPTFWLDAFLRNDMFLDIGLVGTLDILKLGATASIGGIDVLGFNSVSLNNLLGISNELFSTPKAKFLINESVFALGGFNRIQGDSFMLAVNPVPEPGTLLLFISGLGLLMIRRKATVGPVLQ